jgi:hypothetical protein
MLPKIHALIGIILSILICLIFHISLFYTFVVFFASVFIDFDHYVWFVIKKKDFSLKNAYHHFKEKRKIFHKLSNKEKHKHKMPYLIFHVIEFWIILFLLSYFNKIFLFVLIGTLIHMLLDYIEIIHNKTLFYPKLSLILTYFINQKKKKHFY